MTFRKSLLWSAATCGLLFPAALVADLDKQKKDEEDAKKAQAEMGDDEHEAYHDRLAQEGEKNLEEINRLLDEIQKNLGSKDTGAATQARQKQVVERLEKLIKELEKG